MATIAIPETPKQEALPATYRAAVVHAFGQALTVEQIPTPENGLRA